MPASSGVLSLDELPDVLTLGEAAAVLRISESGARALAASGELPARKVGQQWRIGREVLREFIGSGA